MLGRAFCSLNWTACVSIIFHKMILLSVEPLLLLTVVHYRSTGKCVCLHLLGCRDTVVAWRCPLGQFETILFMECRLGDDMPCKANCMHHQSRKRNNKSDEIVCFCILFISHNKTKLTNYGIYIQIQNHLLMTFSLE